jgi:hypothetical protein
MLTTAHSVKNKYKFCWPECRRTRAWSLFLRQLDPFYKHLVYFINIYLCFALLSTSRPSKIFLSYKLHDKNFVRIYFLSHGCYLESRYIPLTVWRWHHSTVCCTWWWQQSHLPINSCTFIKRNVKCILLLKVKSSSAAVNIRALNCKNCCTIDQTYRESLP